MKKIVLIIALLFFANIYSQEIYLDSDNLEDKIILKENNVASININRKKINIFLDKIPLDKLHDRTGDIIDFDIFSNKKMQIIILGSCCVGVTETAYYEYIPKVDNWLMYKTIYSEISANMISDVSVKYFPYNRSIDNKIYPPNTKLFNLNISNSRQTSNFIFNIEYKKLQKSNNLKNYNFKYSIPEICELLENIPINDDNVDKYNNLTYYLSKINQDKQILAVYMFEKIIEKFPERVVAYLNIADTYWELEDKDAAKENYKKYIALMKSQNKDLKRIPQQVWERTK
ncbi:MULTISPECIES: tetratricopeptide repeat protein [unclassified Chryseobacterium]|uniref:tetratricopeptide repeat protein n=1 Tax=unclassified Chryseobacterium TaxID=2593645 RepID=UPI0022698F17|nr:MULTISPECIES: tetratricopeptide repeat protein [unclassified Chryseobacterium]